MAEDLLEEIQEDETDPDNSDNGDTQDPLSESEPGKLGGIRKLFGGKKKLVLIGIIVLVALGLGAGAWLLFFSGGDEAEPQESVGEKVEVVKELIEEIIFEDIVVLEPFERIPLKGASAMEFISLGVSLELSDHRYRKQVYTLQDRIRKVVIAQVREATWLELRNPEGKIRLKYDLLKRINSMFPKVTVRNLYFTQFLMQ